MIYINKNLKDVRCCRFLLRQRSKTTSSIARKVSQHALDLYRVWCFSRDWMNWMDGWMDEEIEL